MTWKPGHAVPFLILPLLGGCGDGSSASGPQRTDSAGVELVVNVAPDRPLSWEFEEVLRLGGADDGPEAFFQVYDRSVAVAPQGTIYVMDQGNHRLRAFDDRGRPLWSAGREGQGPGEFRVPTGVAANPDGTVSVWDVGKRSVIDYGSDGTFLRERPVEGTGFFGSESARPREGAEVVAWREQLPEEGLERRILRWVEGADTLALQHHEAPLYGLVRVDACGTPLAMRLGPFFAPGFHWAARGDRVASAWGWPDYRIDIHHGGRLVRSVRRSGDLTQVDEEAVRAENPEGFRVSFGAEPCELDLDELMEKRGWADVIPAVSDVALSPSGELWVEREVAGQDAPVDVFDVTGAYVGTLPPGTPFPAAFLPDGRVVSVEENELDVPFVVVYRVVRPAGDQQAG